MGQSKKSFRIRGEVPAINKTIDETIEADTHFTARRIMEKRLEQRYGRRISVAYCLVDEVNIILY